jgi:hypothetical protein
MAVRRTHVLILAFAVAIPVLQALNSFDSTLRALHGPDRPSYGVGALTGFGFHPDKDKPRDVVAVWRTADADWQTSQEHASEDVTTVLRNYMLLDFALGVLYGIAFAFLALVLRDRIAQLVEADEDRLADLSGDADPLGPRRWRFARQILLARQSLLGAAIAAALLVVADRIENVSSWWLGLRDAQYWDTHRRLLHTLFWIGFGSAWAKTILLVIVVLALALGALWVVVLDRDGGRRVWRVVVVLRGQIAIVAALAFLLFAPITAAQGADVMLRWRDHPAEAAYAAFLALLLGVLLWLGARELVHTERTAIGARHTTKISLVLGGVLIGGAVLIWRVHPTWNAKTYLALGIATLLLALANAWAAPLGAEPPKPHGGAPRLAAVLLGAPLVLLGLALLKPVLVEWMYAQRPEYSPLVALALGAQVVGWALMFSGWSLRGRAPGRAEKLLLGLVSIAALLAFTVAVWLEPLAFPTRIGTIAVALAWLVAISGLVFVLAWWAERYPPAPIFALLRLRRTPLFVLVLAWAIIAGSTQKGSYYDARYVSGTPNTATVDEVFTQWQNRLHLATRKLPKNVPTGTKVGIPMVFVATAGGGIRASYWTALALQCMFESASVNDCTKPLRFDPKPYFFAASGVSGGSVGLAQYVAHVRSGETATDWPAKHAGDDEASAMLAWFLFADIPSAFISRTGGSDRAEMLERTWERTWPSGALGRPLDASDAIRPRGPAVPLVLLNGTRVQDGCRINVSILRGTAAAGGDDTRVSDCLTVRQFRSTTPSPKWTFASTQDVHALLCDSRLRLSTAALLSARFPWVSPSGRLAPCAAKAKTLVTANVVDGGYFDTSAASAIVELWDHVRPEVERFNAEPRSNWCLVPVLVELDNHYAGYPAPASVRPWETSVPLATVQAARNAREANARQAAALAFAGPLSPTVDAVLIDRRRANAAPLPALNRFEELRPAAHPGTEAPLGWALSKASVDDLNHELLDREDNVAALRMVKQWLTPGAIGCRRSKSTR